MPSAKTHNSLIRAAKRNDLVAIRKLIENGANVNLSNDEGENIVHSIVYSGDPRRLKLILNNCLFIIKYYNLTYCQLICCICLS